MSSPFTGMNPYLEQEDAWKDFHDSFLPQLRGVLAPQVSPHYIVKIEEHVFIHEPPADERLLMGYSDVSLSRSNGPSGALASAVSIQAPARIRIPSVDFEKHIYLEIRDRQDRELVT